MSVVLSLKHAAIYCSDGRYGEPMDDFPHNAGCLVLTRCAECGK